MWQARGKIAKQYIQQIDVPCQWLYPHVMCCVDIIISLNVYCTCTDADNKMKENNQHNKILNEHK